MFLRGGQLYPGTAIEGININKIVWYMFGWNCQSGKTESLEITLT